jgi:hypothetical protein
MRSAVDDDRPHQPHTLEGLHSVRLSTIAAVNNQFGVRSVDGTGRAIPSVVETSLLLLPLD